MARLFISHATIDREFLKSQLDGILDALDFDVWYAEEDIKSPEHWERSIRKGLES